MRMARRRGYLRGGIHPGINKSELRRNMVGCVDDTTNKNEYCV